MPKQLDALAAWSEPLGEEQRLTISISGQDPHLLPRVAGGAGSWPEMLIVRAPPEVLRGGGSAALVVFGLAGQLSVAEPACRRRDYAGRGLGRDWLA